MKKTYQLKDRIHLSDLEKGMHIFTENYNEKNIFVNHGFFFIEEINNNKVTGLNLFTKKCEFLTDNKNMFKNTLENKSIVSNYEYFNNAVYLLKNVNFENTTIEQIKEIVKILKIESNFDKYGRLI